MKVWKIIEARWSNVVIWGLQYDWLYIYLINTKYYINFRIMPQFIEFIFCKYFKECVLKRFTSMSCKDMNTKLWMIGRYFAAVNENISLFILMSYLISFHLSKMWCWVSFGIVFKVYAWYAWFEWMMQIIDFLSEGKVITVFSATYKQHS